MEKVARLLVFYKEYFALFTAIILSTLLLFSNENRQVSNIEKSLIDLSGMIQARLAWVNNVFTALDENRSLREGNVRLLLENSQLRKAYIENQLLREKLGFKNQQSHQLVPASVISSGLYHFTKVIQIDIGEKEGIKKNLPVITEKGLVGKILTSGHYCSVVQMIGDVNFGVSARVQNSRATGILVWESGSVWRMENIVKSFAIQPGDSIVTSGMSAIYPPDIPIGEVISVDNNDPGMFKKILIRPFVDYSRLEDVFIILNPPKVEYQLQNDHEAEN